MPAIINPYDLYALKQGLTIRDKFGGKVTAIKYGTGAGNHQASDGDTAQAGPQVAEYLNIPQITYVGEIKINHNPSGAHHKLIAERVIEDRYEKIECNLPALITVTKELNKPRYPTYRLLRFGMQTI